jgi:opacity protein-like surface antigen
MLTRTCIRAATAFTALMLINCIALASPFTESSRREGGFEIVLQTHYTESSTLSGSGGSSVDINDDWGAGFGFGYNFTEHWEFNFDVGWNSFNYSATAGGDVDPEFSNKYNGQLDTSSSLFSATYNFMDKRFTPFVSGALGWVFIDTNIPTGPPGTSCWWDPWYGYICSSYVPTKTSTEFTYGGTVGVRMDLAPSFFLRLGYNMMWLDLDNVDSTSFNSWRLDAGFLMK